MWLQTGESSERAAFADIGLKEQGEIRALQEEEEEGGGRGGGVCKLGKALCIIKLSSGREAPRNMTWSYCEGWG